MIFTALASILWCSVNAVVGSFYRWGLLKSQRLPIRTISVGNIQAGGSGKTPVVAELAREALQRGLQPVILTRGYGGRWSTSGGVIGPGHPAPEAEVCGDEVKLLASLVPEAWIGVGKNRARSLEQVQAAGGHPNLAILDDGFQHFRLKRDVDIVLMTSQGFTDRLYREFPRALRRATLVIWTKGRGLATGQKEAQISLQPPGPTQPAKRFWLVSGVGDPEHLEQSVRQAGYRVERHIRFRDHARYSLEHLESVRISAEREGVRLLTTGKDWVKWEELGFLHGERIEPVLQWVQGRDLWENLLWGH